MRNINITIEDEVYFGCHQLIKERQLSNTINSFLKNYLEISDSEILKEKKLLLKKKEALSLELSEVSTRLMLVEKEEQKTFNESEQQTLSVLEGMRKNNPLKDL